MNGYLLGQNIQAGEQAKGFVEVEVGDVATSFLVEQFQGQQTEQRRRGWDHTRAGIARLSHQVIEPKSGQEREEEKDPGHARLEAPSWCQNELVAIGRGLGIGLY